MRIKLIRLTCYALVLGLATVASADLLVHYKLDETSGTVAADVSGNGFDGVVNADTNWVAGTIDGALEFTGDTNVTLPGESMELFSDNGSVAFWMKADSATGIYTMFWGGDNLTGTGFGPENEMHVHIESAVEDIWAGGELSFFAIADPSAHIYSDPSKGTDPATPPVDPRLVTDMEWHHVAAIWSDVNGTMQLYLDGEFIMEADYLSTAYPLTNIFLGQMGSGNRPFIGVLDDVRIYTNALTEEEVFALYEKQDVFVNDKPAIQPHEFALNQNYPNPFNPTTTISYSLPKATMATLSIYNMVGQKVATLSDGLHQAGSFNVTWTGLDDFGEPVNSGLYIYKLQTENHSIAKKMVLMK